MQFIKKYWVAIVAILYSGFILVYTLAFMFLVNGENQLLPSNELGDFLAGAFAPLAFFILIMGYIQQGKELQQNTAALQLQADELKNSVEQQKLLLETAKADLDLAKSQTQIRYQKELILAQPFIHLTVNAQKQKTDNRYSVVYIEDLFNYLLVSIHVKNTRALAREMELTVEWDNKEIINKYFDFLESDRKTIQYKFDYPNCFLENYFMKLRCTVKYLDEMDNSQYQVFQIRIERNTEKADLVAGISRIGRSY